MVSIARGNFTLSERQKMLLEFVGDFTTRRGYPPTLREIMRNTDFTSTSVISYNVNRLVENGYLEKEEKVSRGLRLLPRPAEGDTPGIINVPLLRRVIVSPYGHIPKTGLRQSIPVSWLADIPLHQVYALNVKSRLMYDAMVTPGDVIVLQRQHTAEDDDLVMVVIDPTRETRIRRIRFEGGHVRLEPLLHAIQPQTLPSEQVHVVGKVVGLMRQF
jgi:repressor LexA